MTRRALLAAGPLAATAQSQVHDSIRRLRPLAGSAAPIAEAEFAARIEQARRLMAQRRIGAMVLEPGASMLYFTGARWGLSERLFALVLPARGEPVYVVAAFEESRAREQIRAGADIRTWQEDESPYRTVIEALKDRGAGTGRVGIGETVRFFAFDGLRREAGSIEYVSAEPVTSGCRMIKSPAEIALLQRAHDITHEGLRAAFATLHEGMSHTELRDNCSAAFRALGADGFALVAFGEVSTLPHGSSRRQILREGDTVLVDAGCRVEGYISDVTRTTVFGKPHELQQRIWTLEKKAQDAGIAAARPGASCEDVDAAVRNVIVEAGFGPGYKLPGVPHRTGHGIGMEGHEHPYIVRGNKNPLRAGMCFSVEPTIVIPGKFGIRLEDCVYITGTGRALFTRQSIAIDEPFAPPETNS